MDPHRWQIVARILEEARSLPTGLRHDYLLQACGDQEDLRREVDSLLAVDDEAAALLAEPLLTEPNLIGRQLGPYRIVRELGAGGMGTVYFAEQAHPVRRGVALKLVNTQRPSALQQQRFALEQDILGRLNHSAVAKLYQSGLAGNGRAYFVMEYIEGLPITEYCDQRRLPLRDRIQLIMKVCDAVAHVHLKGVTHRDLKPSNILVQHEGDNAQPKIIDFGIAKDSRAHENLTHDGAMPGTLRYMSPEQAGLSDSNGHGRDCDARTDVYALGVVLFELLVGGPPLTWRQGLPPFAICHLICQQPPALADAAWQQLDLDERERRAAKRNQSGTAVASQLRGDLRWILARALAKDPEQRYQSARELAQDLQRLLDHLPVEARRPSLGYIMGKFVKRRLAAVAVVATTLFLTLGFTVLLFLQQQQTALERDRARQERDAAKSITKFLVDLFQSNDPYKKHGGQLTVTELMATSRDRIDRQLENQPQLRARLLGVMGRVYHNLGMPDQARPLLLQALSDPDQLAQKVPEVLFNNLRFMALLEEDSGDYAAAERHLTRAAALAADLYSTDGLFYHEVRNMQAHLQFQQGQFESAEPLLEETLAALRQHPTFDPIIIGRTLNNLGVLKQRQGKYDEAGPLFSESLAIHSDMYGAYHPLIAVLRNNLAAVHFQRGDYPTAEQHYLASLAIKRRRLGDRHLSIANSLNNLAVLHQEQGKWREAADELCQAIQIRENHTTKVTLTLAQGYTNLGRNQTLLAEYDAARANLELGEAMIRATFGDDHPHLPLVLNNTAANAAERGDHATAAWLYSEALHHSLTYKRTSDLITAILTAGLAESCNHMGDSESAVYYAESALGLLDDSGHGAHWRYHHTLATLGVVYLDMGRTAEAEPLLRRAYQELVTRFGEGHWKNETARKALHRLEREASPQRALLAPAKQSVSSNLN